MQYLFLALTLAMVGFLSSLFRRAGIPRIWNIALLMWLVAQIYLADRGFFTDFTAIPPHLAFVVLPAIALLVVAAIHPGTGPLFLTVPPRWLVGFQSFRIVMEFILYTLISQRLVPEILTFTGSNYDVLVGLTAPFVCYFWLKPGAEKFRLVRAWNVIGFLILTNTFVHALLAAPTPFQVFYTDPPNTLVAHSPWIWLPGFLVPLALIGHVLSFRQLKTLSDGRADLKPGSPRISNFVGHRRGFEFVAGEFNVITLLRNPLYKMTEMPKTFSRIVSDFRIEKFLSGHSDSILKCARFLLRHAQN
jgi:hypothetical protein